VGWFAMRHGAMSLFGPNQEPVPARGQWFVTTHWSVVVAAGRPDSPQVIEALEKLCRTYWYPLYAYVRRRGKNAHDAEDLTQAFFERLLEKNYIADARRERGRFRCFLLSAFNHFLADEWGRTHAAKRGGDATFVSLDAQDAEERYKLEPADETDAEKLFHRRWALTLLETVVGQLRAELAAAGKGQQFDVLQGFLMGDKPGVSYGEAAARLNMSEGAARVAVHRLRQRCRQLFRDQIAHTVSGPAEVEDEIRHMFAVLS
jgi:RNA polymerase sigma-70 factor (ECF subfamily)